VIVEVLDDGPGISTTIRDQIFEPFVTGHGSGTGLGLYIARELCEANGARLDLVPGPSELGGALFRLDIEVAHDERAKN
jgi:two-component system sensor histidine kinase PilS (NtrC family)